MDIHNNNGSAPDGTSIVRRMDLTLFFPHPPVFPSQAAFIITSIHTPIAAVLSSVV